MLYIAHLFKIKTVVTVHGLDWQRSKWGGMATRYIKLGEKTAAKYADEIIVLSESVKKYFMETYNRKANFIPNGVNKPIKYGEELILKKYGLKKGEYILFLARIVPEKGLHYLINAYKELNTDKKLVIAGGASHTNDYFKQIKELVKDNDNIIMTGFVQGRILGELFENCCVYCLPSDVEGMPISLLEAMSYGCNCLVSDIDENLQVIGKLGTHFKKSDQNDLRKKLQLMLEVQEDDDIKKRRSDYILNNYGWDKVVDETQKVYKNAIRGER